MSNPILLETALQDLKGLLAKLSLGETVTLADEDGKPIGLLVSLTSALPKPEYDPDWIKRWDALAKEVGEAWQGDQSAVDTLSEMRR